MSRIYSKKRALLGVVASLAIAAVAIAYWTTGGSGDGTAPVQDAGDLAVLTLSQDALDDMYPGDSAQTISGTLHNSNDASIHVDNVVVSIESVTDGAGTDCEADDFTLTNATMDVEAQVPGHDGTDDGSLPFGGASDGATIKFNNEANEDQNDCKGATVNLDYDIN